MVRFSAEAKNPESRIQNRRTIGSMVERLYSGPTYGTAPPKI